MNGKFNSAKMLKRLSVLVIIAAMISVTLLTGSAYTVVVGVLLLIRLLGLSG